VADDDEVAPVALPFIQLRHAMNIADELICSLPLGSHHDVVCVAFGAAVLDRSAALPSRWRAGERTASEFPQPISSTESSSSTKRARSIVNTGA
jgi:hypothetical protein